MRSAIAHMGFVLAIAAGGGIFTASGAAQDGEPVPEVVSGQLDRLRTQWPEVSRAEMRGGRRFEYRDNSIRVGTDTLRDLASDPANANGVVLTFLLAHEGWHAVQYARRSAAEIQLMKENRMLECEADFMGAAVAYRAAAAAGLSPDALSSSRRALQAYFRAHSARPGGAAAYPSPDNRALTISIGWSQAASPGLFRNAAGRPAPMAEDARANQVCARITHTGDSSLGIVVTNWPQQNIALQTETPLVERTMTVENRSPRPVTVGFLALSRYVGPDDRPVLGGPDDSEIYDILDDTLTIPPRGSETRTYSFPSRNAPGVRGYSWLETPVAAGPFSQLIVSRYADVEAPVAYCFERVAGAAEESAQDRALLARLASIALAAEDDFRPILGREAYDSERGSRSVAVMAALNPTGEDTISSGISGASVFMTVFKNDDEAAVMAEFTRLKGLLRRLCGPASMTAEALNPGEEPGMEVMALDRFAPRASVRLAVGLQRTFYARQTTPTPESERRRGGEINVMVARQAAR